MSDAVYIDLGFSPTWELIPDVRRFVTTFYDKFLDSEAAQRIALATHELLENAVKYSDKPEGRVYVSVADRGGSEVLIRITSQGSDEHIKNLEVSFARMDQAPDPDQHYQELMRETLTKAEGSGLGLARVWAEAEFDLSLILEDHRVTIEARSRASKDLGGTA